VNAIDKPKKRTRLRQILGKEYFILKRKWHWAFAGKHYATQQLEGDFKHTIFKHQSLILRPLKDVDMYLQENKRTNLRLAIQHLNQIEIKPNEYFSLWKLVGRPTQQKGYLEGLVLNNGKIDKDIGGGLCQLGNLLFWIFAHSPLTITERYRHGFDVFPDINRKVPFGAGATLSYNYIDLQVKNETHNSFVIKLWLDKTHLHGELFSKNKLNTSYAIEERNHHIKQQIWGGYSRHNQIIKRCITADSETETVLVENHAIMMYNPFLEDKSKT
jgi:vancomycin resistance protein VanW